MAINHSGHNHPATTKARQACRKAIMTQSPDTWTTWRTTPQPEHRPTHVDGRHCQSCGATDYESLELGDQGYTACCNEPVVSDCDPDYCYHR